MAATSAASAEFWRDPALPFAESRRACHSRACYKPHSHPTFSIGVVDQGRSCFTGATGGPAVIEPGTLVFVPAAQVHSCNPLPDSAWSYQMLHLDAAWLQTLWQEAGLAQDRALSLSRDAGLYARFCRLNAVLFSAASLQDKEVALIEFIADFDDRSQSNPATPDPTQLSRNRLQPVFEQLQNGAAGQASLTELAGMAEMSRYQLIRVFRRATGMTPHAYQLNLRINQARVGLRSGESLADLAYRLGFADQGHFQRVFKAHVGVTPGSYRA